MISLPRLRNLVQYRPDRFIIKNNRKEHCYVGLKGHVGVIGRIDRRALCHFDVELKMTVNQVEYYEFK